MRLHSHIVLLFFWICFAVLFSNTSQAQFYNGMQMDFGKSRIQYDNFQWVYYKFERFNVYFYEWGDKLAIYTVQSADKNIEELEAIFDFALEDKIYFIVYNKLSHLKQSNIGYSEEEQNNIGGVNRLIGSKVFVYFEGNHEQLNKQIRAGIAEIMINQMMYGGNWKEVVKNSTLLTLPDWYVNGLISYSSENWNEKINNRVKDGILSGRFNKFNRLAGEDAVCAGHTLWNYIAEIYGAKVIPNILYMSRVSRNIESGFLFVLGISLKTLVEESNQYYYKKYGMEADRKLSQTPLPIKTKNTRVYNQLKVSPDGEHFAFVSNEMGQYKVFLYNSNNQKRKCILTREHKLNRINDYSFPLLAWHPNGKILSMIIERKGKPQFYYYDLETKKLEKQPIFAMEKVLDYAYADDGTKLVLSGVFNGQTDIYVYKIASKNQEQITNDIYDDLNPRFINNSKEIIFSSNRKDDTLRTNEKVTLATFEENQLDNNDIFIYNYQDKSTVLRQVTKTKNVDETLPTAFDSIHFTYLNNENGVVNRYIAHIDSAITFIDTSIHYRYFTVSSPVTDYPRNILEQDVSSSSAFSEIVFINGKYQFYINDKKSMVTKLSPKEKEVFQQQTKTKDTTVIGFTKKQNVILSIPYISVLGEKEIVDFSDTNMVDINNYVFNLEKENKEEEKKQKVENVPTTKSRFLTLTSEGKKQKETLVLSEKRNYNTAFSATEMTMRVDFNFANQLYQPFNGGPYFNPGTGIVAKIGIMDLFEDYKMEGGIRFALNGNNTEYFIGVENRIKRLDKKYLFQRQTITSNNYYFQKTHIHQVKQILRWPFNEVSSIISTLSARNDNIVTLTSDTNSLKTPNINYNWGGIKLEYIFDNTISKGLNLYNGTRFKLFAEYYKEIGQSNTDIKVIGVDYRHYQKIHRSLIWANRFASSTSFGHRKLSYYMGAVDNWVVFNNRQKFDFSSRIADDQNFYFQTLATNMRGFIQNARNGNSFAVINSELRCPIFQYLTNKPIKSDFKKNFQIIGFGDIGTAWTGSNPYSDENAFNTTIIKDGTITVTLKNQQEPIIGGYGIGVRSRLWGYFVRVDRAWGVEDGKIQIPITYISLNLDF